MNHLEIGNINTKFSFHQLVHKFWGKYILKGRWKLAVSQAPL